MTTEPAALSALRLGPSGVTLIEGSRDLRKRVCMRGKKQDLSEEMNIQKILIALPNVLAVYSISDHYIPYILLAFDAYFCFTVKLLTTCTQEFESCVPRQGR